MNGYKQIISRLLDGAIVVTLLAALTQTASAKFSPLPDASSTCALMGVVCAGLVLVRSRLRR